MRVLKVLGLVLLTISLILILVEAYGYFRDGYWQSYPLGQFWYSISPGSLNLTQAITERYLHWRLWDYGIGQLVIWPLWVTTGGLGLIFFGFGGRKKLSS